MSSNVDGRPVKIYVLIDPRDGSPRYIGRTVKDLSTRLSGHMSSKDNTYRARWAQKLRRAGLRPSIELLEEVDHTVWEEAEQFWISYFKFIGARLVNTTSGGDYDPLKIKMMNEARRNTPVSLEIRNYMSVLMTGRVMSAETRQKISKIHKGKVVSEATGNKISEAKLGGTHTQETKDKMSASHKGRKKSDEAIRKSVETKRRKRLEKLAELQEAA